MNEDELTEVIQWSERCGDYGVVAWCDKEDEYGMLKDMMEDLHTAFWVCDRIIKAVDERAKNEKEAQARRESLRSTQK